MKVFISWSGDTSLKVAQMLREWLPYIINSIEPYVSSEDIDKGARWSTDIAKELENSTFGILCVTKDNLEAPWLSFEAGALSKTMEKSFVTPFLFNIKRSEVQGPILQFQSTIFEKNDIKKMLKTLNKACGDAGIPESRLDKSFDVWYPTLEEGLNNLKNTIANSDKNKEAKSSIHSSEMLEEILVLSRDNQKLLKSPDEKLHEDIEKVKESLNEISKFYNILYDQKKMKRKDSSVIVEQIIRRKHNGDIYGFLMILSLFKEDFPWIHDMGKDLVDILKSKKSSAEKTIAIRNFSEMVDYTSGHPIMREIFGRDRDNMLFMQDLSYALISYLDDMYDKYK
ncbi:MAG: toll/interleukin-1 receptor domain-containing protein [Eubacterium sp.]|nr:toll/interleukin-1 receptor domain-containing protein [Eubacterium sp.]